MQIILVFLHYLVGVDENTRKILPCLHNEYIKYKKHKVNWIECRWKPLKTKLA